MPEQEELKKILLELQSQLALVDLMNGGSNKQQKEFLILKSGHIKLEIYGELTTHKLPHFHITFKKMYSASYQIDPIKKLVGVMPRQYEKPILNWAENNKEILNKAWVDINISGTKPVPIILN